MFHKRYGVFSPRIALGFMVATALTSCGGRIISSGPTGTTITASFTGATMPGAVAYQVGTTGKFQTLVLSRESVTFTLPSETEAYGVAYICPTFLDGYYFSNESIIQATTSDTTSLSLACPSQSGVVSATFDASAIPGATSVFLYVGYRSDQIFGTSGSVGLSGIPTGTFDIALLAEGANGALALQIQRGVSITRSTTVTFPPMTSADELGSAPVSITGVTSSATSSGFSTTYNTSGGLSIILPGPFNGLPQSTYPTAPSSLSQPGDFYLIQAVANLANQSITAELSSSTASALTVALPPPLSSVIAPTAAAFPTFHANTSGFTVAGTVVNSASIQFQTTPSINSTFYNIYAYVTQTWLGANTTFTIPDLSMLAGFAPSPPRGGEEPWALYSTAGTPLQINPLQQSGAETLTSPMSLQYIQSSGAFATP